MEKIQKETRTSAFSAISHPHVINALSQFFTGTHTRLKSHRSKSTQGARGQE